MSGSETFEIVALVSITGLSMAVLATLVGVPIGGLLGRGGGGRMVHSAAFGLTRIATPIFLGTSAVILASGVRLELTFTPTALAVVQALVGLPLVIGSTVRAIEALPSAAIEQLDALRVSRVQEMRILIAEIWSGVVASVVATFAVAVMLAGGVLVAGGAVSTETRITAPVFVEEVGGRSGQVAGFALLALATTAALALLPVWRRW